MAEKMSFQATIENAVQTALAAALPQVIAAVRPTVSTNGNGKSVGHVSKTGRNLDQKDRSTVAGFKRKGIKESEIHLMDRDNPKAEFNVRSYQGWLINGRQVRKGEKSVRGLFHVSQTDPIKAKSN